MDILVLIFLAYQIGNLALRKGEAAGKWRLTLVIAWIAAEVIGGIIGIIIFGMDNTISWLLIAWGCALTAYFVVKNYLDKLPDADIDL
ncbi:hypothetical protein ACFOWM_08075 [Ferruginibacter yonginensis]|uniref:Uncharacterized protein n=1 Tax=Ferruginibacter yonginensis TaxID=1310416 RepID=A0ABV8QV70_9BACT